LPPAHCQKETNPVVEVLLGVHDFAAKNDPGMTIIGALAKNNTTYKCFNKAPKHYLGFLASTAK